MLQPCQDEQRSHKKPPSSIAVETSSDKSSLVHGIPSISPPGLHFIQNPSQHQPSDTSLVSCLRQVYDDRLDEVFALPNHPSAAHCLRSSTSTHTNDARESGGFNNRRGLVRLTRSLQQLQERERRSTRCHVLIHSPFDRFPSTENSLRRLEEYHFHQRCRGLCHRHPTTSITLSFRLLQPRCTTVVRLPL